MAFFCHHAIADGLSAGAFNLTFLDALNHLIDHPSDIAYKSVIEVPKLPLVPNLELRTPLPLSFFFLLKQFFKAYIYDHRDTLEWSGPPIHVFYASSTTPQYPQLLAPTHHGQHNRFALPRRENNRDGTHDNPHRSLVRHHLPNLQTFLQ
jgi:hypothetical protein